MAPPSCGSSRMGSTLSRRLHSTMPNTKKPFRVDGGAAITIRLDPIDGSGTAAVTVLDDETGAPIASAELRVLRWGGSDRPTDTDGVFTTDPLPAGDYSVNVSHPDYIYDIYTDGRFGVNGNAHSTVRIVRERPYVCCLCL